MVAAFGLWLALSVGGAALVSPVWAGVVTFWFGCLAVQRVAGLSVPAGLLRWHMAGTLVFPVVATAVKWHERASGAVESTGLSNRLQHGGWAFCTVLLFVPALRRWTGRLCRVELMLLAMALVALLGNLNEVGEWARHTITSGRAYDDTIKDLLMNAAGSGLGALVLVQARRREVSAK